ncbi:MAG: hypothetical protein DIU65_16420 [Proteobacteria bacterium]|nr:MAG: hypothetical protein DIU65_16420 [Pseudomonadota bacterium]
MADRIVIFVLGGGSGSRLWPLSRAERPKQFHDLSGAGPMLALTLRRLQARPGGQTSLFVVGSERHASDLLEMARSARLGAGTLILEPAARGTAAAVAIAAVHTMELYGDALVLAAPSDHEIRTDSQFWQTIEDGVAAAHAGQLVVFGVTPSRPETGYGYIEVGPGRAGGHQVLKFVEKPDLEMATSFFESGRFVWNSGIFLARASVLLEAFCRFEPALLEGARAALAGAMADFRGLHLCAEAFLVMPTRSFDHAVMEHAENVVMVPARFSWDDIGSWRSLVSLGPTDANGNVVVGDVMAVDCHNSYLRSEGRLLTVIGLRDMAVVATGDATLVAPLGCSQDVRSIVSKLEAANRSEALRHNPVPVRRPLKTKP